jgi:hypothetical protein
MWEGAAKDPTEPVTRSKFTLELSLVNSVQPTQHRQNDQAYGYPFAQTMRTTILIAM